MVMTSGWIPKPEHPGVPDFRNSREFFQDFCHFQKCLIQRPSIYYVITKNCQFQKNTPLLDDVINFFSLFSLGKKKSTRDKSLKKFSSPSPDDVINGWPHGFTIIVNVATQPNSLLTHKIIQCTLITWSMRLRSQMSQIKSNDIGSFQ